MSEGTYYQWLAESIVMTDHYMAKDILAAIDHAVNVPGKITPVQADRLARLGRCIDSLTTPASWSQADRERVAAERIRRAVAS